MELKIFNEQGNRYFLLQLVRIIKSNKLKLCNLTITIITVTNNNNYYCTVIIKL